jgi:superkiller protein 3
VYYLEVANPSDPTRASKCFQKAFELDATQAGAARRLAERFAEEREWDLVEVVARRTIEGEGGNEKNTSKHLPVNSWAWKALGVVELV